MKPAPTNECGQSRPPFSDRTSGSGIAVWIALHRAHQGAVTNLAGHWLDSGRPVPGYLATALDRLTRDRLLTLSDVDLVSCGVRRVIVTDAGCAGYVALCRMHDPTQRVASSYQPCARWRTYSRLGVNS
ncbi:MAG: hypothetical protein M3460_26085 [Actinomycetota bacterium]|nr:hypothetical protein [Actinomycetota bacterium]